LKTRLGCRNLLVQRNFAPPQAAQQNPPAADTAGFA
jgi:hypothetical protein